MELEKFIEYLVWIVFFALVVVGVGVLLVNLGVKF